MLERSLKSNFSSVQELHHHVKRFRWVFQHWLLHEMFVSQRRMIEKMFSEMIFDRRIIFLQTPPFALPHFFNFIPLLLVVLTLHLVLLASLHSPLSICCIRTKLFFFIWTLVMKTSRSFTHSVTMIANSAYTETINFLLWTSSKITLNSQSGWFRWKIEKSFFSNERNLFRWGVTVWPSLS